MGGKRTGTAVLAALALSACGTGGGGSASRPAPSATTPAAGLRATLGTLLQQHVALAADATGAALGGRTAEFEAAAAVLTGRNADDLAAAVGSVYGDDAAETFKSLWNRHIGFFVDYTEATAAKDRARRDRAVADLVRYTKDFGAFLGGATGLAPDAVAALVKDHVLGLKSVVDAQAAGKARAAYDALYEAIAHMDMIGSALADAIVRQNPAKF